jgi:hypothetical protein
MTTGQECLDYARECVRLAGMANDPELREHLLQLAREWIAAATKEGEASERGAPRMQ